VRWLVLASLTAALATGIVLKGGVWPRQWDWSVLVIALAAVALWLLSDQRHHAPADRWTTLLIAAFAGWCALQLVPLPVWLVAILSPTRAALARAACLPSRAATVSGGTRAAGCSIEGRALRPLEAAHATVAACNLGIEHLLHNEPAHATAVNLLQHNSVDKLFRIGWHLLTQQVVIPAARAFEKRLVHEAREGTDRERARRLEQASRTLHTAIAAGKPWTALSKLADLDSDLEVAMLGALVGLIDECPSLRGQLAGQAGAMPEIQFIATRQQLQSVQAFLAEL